MAKERDFCGCCGREMGVGCVRGDSLFCEDCYAHIGKVGPAWERTWFGQWGTDCPYQINKNNFMPASWHEAIARYGLAFGIDGNANKFTSLKQIQNVIEATAIIAHESAKEGTYSLHIFMDNEPPYSANIGLFATVGEKDADFLHAFFEVKANRSELFCWRLEHGGPFLASCLEALGYANEVIAMVRWAKDLNITGEANNAE